MTVLGAALPDQVSVLPATNGPPAVKPPNAAAPVAKAGPGNTWLKPAEEVASRIDICRYRMSGMPVPGGANEANWKAPLARAVSASDERESTPMPLAEAR